MHCVHTFFSFFFAFRLYKLLISNENIGRKNTAPESLDFRGRLACKSVMKRLFSWLNLLDVREVAPLLSA